MHCASFSTSFSLEISRGSQPKSGLTIKQRKHAQPRTAILDTLFEPMQNLRIFENPSSRKLEKEDAAKVA